MEQILAEYDIDEIVLFGGGKTAFITELFAEGEGEQKFYSSAWLCNPYIYDYFKKTCRIVWNRRSGYTLRLFCHIRNQMISFWSLLYMIARDVTLSSHIDHIQCNETRELIVCIANLPLQYTHLMKLCSDSRRYEPVFVCNRRIKRDGTQNTVLVKAGFDYITKTYLRIKKVSKCRKKTIIELKYKNFGITFQMRAILKAYFLSAFVVGCEKKRTEKTLKFISSVKKTSYVLTDMTIGKDIVAVNEAAKAARICHVNFQYVLMTRILYPNLNLADKYFLYAKKTYELYKLYDKSYQYYVPFKHIKCIKNIKRTFTVFTQADNYTEHYLYAVKEIAKVLTENGIDINLNLKLHYRQNLKEEFEKLTELYDGMRIIDGPVEDLICSSDVVLSMTSSVIFESVMMHVPAIIMDFNGVNQYYIENNDICCCEINRVIHSANELIGIMDNFELFLDDYNKKFAKYFEYAPRRYGIDDYL